MNRVLRSLAGLALLAAPLVAQDPVIAARMSGVGGSPEPKDCKLPPGHFLVSSAGTYVKTALGASLVDNRIRALHDAARTSLQAITQSDQGTNPAAWYYLGRADGLLGDFPGADSAFKRTLALRPDCATELENVRIALWYPVVTAAIGFQDAGHADSALYLYRAAYKLYAGKPGALTNMGRIFKDAGQTDSAMFYLEKALAVATDTSANGRNIASATASGLGTLYYNAGRYPDAVRVFRIASQLDPKDADGLKNLGIAFRAAGMPDSAKAINDRILAAAQASGSVTPDQQFDVGVAQFNAKKYADAAASFRNVIAADPNRHDAIENLANSYLALDSTAALIATTSQLLALEPMNYDALRLLASGYRKAKQQQKTIDTFNRVLGITTSLDAGGFTVAADKATLMLHAQGRAGTDPNGKVLAPAGYQIVVEFLDVGGKVVTSQTVAVPALATDATQDLTVTGTGAGIAGWRYHKA